MSTVVIKDLPEPLHRRLKERARGNHRSMTKEAIHLIDAGLDGAGGALTSSSPLAPRRGGESETTAAWAMHAAAALRGAADGVPDGREALRAALVKQSNGSYLNVLGIEDESFFEALDHFRAETPAPNMDGMFDEAACCMCWIRTYRVNWSSRVPMQGLSNAC